MRPDDDDFREEAALRDSLDQEEAARQRAEQAFADHFDNDWSNP